MTECCNLGHLQRTEVYLTPSSGLKKYKIVILYLVRVLCIPHVAGASRGESSALDHLVLIGQSWAHGTAEAEDVLK